jgi:hypothetical protein
MLAQHELNLHLHFASGASAEHTTRRLPTTMIFVRSAAMRISGASLATRRALASTDAATARQHPRSMPVPDAQAQPLARSAQVAVRLPVLRHWLRRHELSELQTSRSRIEHMHRLSVTRIRTSEQHSAGLAAAQPRGTRPQWLPTTPAGAPLQPPLQHRLRRHRSQAAQTTTLAWSTAVERRWMSRAQPRTAPDERRAPSAAPLTWRKSASAGVGSTAAPPAATAAPAPSVLTTVHHSQPHQQPQRDSAPTVLSRAAIDRLAEDVMQRLERRVRIERERRGL